MKVGRVRTLPRIEKQTGLSLASQQAETVRLALTSTVTIVTGGPGGGKTTLIDTVLRILETTGITLRLCAPDRADRRMTEATAMEARTIHRLLEVTIEVRAVYQRIQTHSGEFGPTRYSTTEQVTSEWCADSAPLPSDRNDMTLHVHAE